jgi:hypothetical protein
MAEFKLGRIRFVWKGVWNTPVDYIVDDVVEYSGKTYICVVTHTSAVFADDLADTTPKWNLMADGVSWGGVWQDDQDYAPGTIVTYGGTTYICITAHTSSATLELDQVGTPVWEAFATSFSWNSDWVGTHTYKVNDVVKYGGYVYVCTVAHTSQAQLTDDSGNWQVFNAGLEYKGAWSSSSVYYKLNDVVKYGADLWICSTAHTSSATFSVSNFTIFVNGFQFESSWSDATTYQVGDVVTYGGYTYVAIQNHSNQTPSFL